MARSHKMAEAKEEKTVAPGRKKHSELEVRKGQTQGGKPRSYMAKLSQE